MRRLGVVALIGYALHFPAVQIWQNGFDEAACRTMWQVDILQCLAASLAVLLVLPSSASSFHTMLDLSFDILCSTIFKVEIINAPNPTVTISTRV